MKNITLSKIFKNGILCFSVLLILLSPISFSRISINQSSGGNFISVDSHEFGISIVSAQTPAAGSASAKSGGGISDMVKALTNLPELLLGAVGNTVLELVSVITWFGGKLLDTSIEKLVLGFGEQINGSSFGSTIDQTWSLIRDISNLAFIFGFIYCGIRIILSPDDSSLKTFVSRIIIGALLINFSLFFVKIIIDFSNFTSIQIYNAMIANSGSISSAVAQQLGITSLYKPLEGVDLAKASSSFWFYIMASIFLIITGFIFAASAIMIIVRFVTLVLIMVFSPILFAATVFPQTAKYSTDLWHKLISSAFYVPVYLLLTFVSLQLVGGLNLGGTKDWATALMNNGPATSFTVFINFFVIIFFMMQSLLIANKFSIGGSEMITAKTKTLIGASTAGLAARSGRATLGRLGNYVSKNEDLLDAAAHRRGVAGFMARSALKTSRVAADASFDGRNTALGKKADVGEGRKGGWVSVKKEVEEKEHKFAKSLGEIDEKDELVKRRSDAITSAETRLKAAKDTFAKAGKGTPEEKSAGLEIEKIEKEVKKAKELYSHEKNRRILGSSFSSEENASAITEAKKKHDALQADIKKSWKEYEEITDADERDLAKGIIQTMEAQAKKAKKELALIQAQRGDGYAKGLEESTRINSWPTGRLAVHNQEAGKAIRKATIKNSGKTDEEIRNEKLIEAVKASKS